jgi:small subunit ribosomal protein S1
VVDIETEESFAALFEASLQKPRRQLTPGEKVTGVVTQVGAERVLVDLGDGLDGLADLGEFAERGGTPEVKKGDRVEMYVVRVENRAGVLAKSLGRGPAARLALGESARTGVPVEGLVSEVNKGGYSVEVAGVRCFCPMGQMDTRRIEDPNTMVGQRLQFRVTELRGARDVVLSRRVLLEEVAAEKAKATREKLSVGARFAGVVTGVRDFGAFVDIGGLEGLVPVSELSYGRQRPQDVVRAGQEVEVEVIRIEPPGPKDRSERLTLSMRALAADPWEASIADLVEGDIVKGTVQRVQPFGAFVEIVPGVDGLLHVSAFGKRVGHPSEMVTPGDEIAVRVEGVDRGNRRLSLSFVPPEELAAIAPQEEPAPAVESAPVVEAAAPKPVPEGGAGMRVRRPAKEEKPVEVAAKPAASAPAPSSKPKVLGRSAPVERPAPAAKGEPAARPAPRKPEELAAPPVGTVLEVTVDKIETFGLFVKWAGGRGLLPASELETAKNADLRKAFPVGTVLKAAVVETRPDGKVRLSATAAAQAEERNEARAWMESQRGGGASSGGGKGFGTLGDLLAKFGKK